MQNPTAGEIERLTAQTGRPVPGGRAYALLFKVFFWDDYVARRLSDLQVRCPGAELWVVVDDTHGYVEGIRHERVFRTTRADMLRMGMPDQPGANPDRNNDDYQLLAFQAAYSDFPYYVMVEHDAVVHRDIDSLVAEAAAGHIDFIALPSRTPIESWGGIDTVESIWPRERILRYLLSIAVFSEAAVAYLLRQRRLMAARYAAGDPGTWPIAEAFVPTVLRDGGFRLESLERFGSTACLGWWPPYHESELPALVQEAFLHPVLTGQRYVESVLRSPSPDTWFDPHSLLRRKLDRESPELVIPALVEAFRARRDVAGLIALRQAVADLGWQEAAFDLDTLLRPFAMPGAMENLALGRFAYQSSASRWSRAPNPAGDAVHATNGSVTGDYGFHTARELRPWWAVDLGRPSLVHEIRVFNRLTAESARSNNLSIWRSTTGRDWSLVHRRVDDTPFGGADGRPLVVSCGAGMAARFIRVELDGTDFLHLDQVEVWGVPFPRA